MAAANVLRVLVYLPSDVPDDLLATLRQHFQAELFRLTASGADGTLSSTQGKIHGRPRLWNKEPCLFRCGTAHAVDWPVQFGAEMQYGDDVTDEWAVVAALYQITAGEGHELARRAVVQLTDDDGQLLLIEAAHHLPDWLEPDCEGNRVFLHAGQLHIVAPPNVAEHEDYDGIGPCPFGPLPLAEGLHAVWASGQDTRASPPIQQAIARKLKNLAAIPTEHRTVLVLPDRLAGVLQVQPQLLAAAVHALGSRDPAAVRACAAMAQFGGQSPGFRFVTVRFSRMLYALFSRQQIRPPASAGYEKAAMAYGSAHAADSPFGESAAQLKMSVELGGRLAYGFELLHGGAETATSASSPTDCSIEQYRDCDARAILRQALSQVDRGDEGARLDDTSPLVHESDSWLTVSETQLNDQLRAAMASESDIAGMFKELMKDDRFFNGDDDGDDDGPEDEPFQLDSEAIEAFRRSLGAEADLSSGPGPAAMLFSQLMQQNRT